MIRSHFKILLHTIIDNDFQDDEAILEDVEPLLVILPTPYQALEAVQRLQQFQEHQPTTQLQDMRYLQQLERQLSYFST